MKPLLLLTALVACLLVSACESDPADRTGKSPVVGATTGIKSQSTHSGNSDGSRTDLR